MANRNHRPNSNNEETHATISVRNVDTKVWHDFKKLAVIHDMSIQDYLKMLTEQEMKRVSISKK